MGVLEPRENAEKVGYPVVGEDIKEDDNVIDYNIREEITIDASSVLNGNNNTTTGMATVIPGVNAPKLIATTSIYGDLGGDPSTVVIEGASSAHPLGSFTYVSTVGNYGDATNKLTIPEKGTYSIELSIWDNQLGYTPNTEHYDDYQILVNGNVVEQIRTPLRLKGELRCAMELKKGDYIQFNYIVDDNPSSSMTRYFTATVTKLG